MKHDRPDPWPQSDAQRIVEAACTRADRPAGRSCTLTREGGTLPSGPLTLISVNLEFEFEGSRVWRNLAPFDARLDRLAKALA